MQASANLNNAKFYSKDLFTEIVIESDQGSSGDWLYNFDNTFQLLEKTQTILKDSDSFLLDTQQENNLTEEEYSYHVFLIFWLCSQLESCL